MLHRHHAGETEQNVLSVARSFLVASELFESKDLGEQIAVGSGLVDLIGGSHIFEFKRRLGLNDEIRSEYVRQLDGYLQSAKTDAPQIRFGVLTDGRSWVLRWPDQSYAAPRPEDIFRLESAEGWFLLYEWLAPQISRSADPLKPTATNIAARLGSGSETYRIALDQLRELRVRAASPESIEVKKELWEDLLAAALGEAGQVADSEDLFLRHTYLSAAVGIAIHSAFDQDVSAIIENEPGELLSGYRFFLDTGIHGAINQGFFSWPAEVGGFEDWIEALADAVNHFDWSGLDLDFARLLYESIISPDERRDLGEYYTPQWLADAVVAEVVTDPLRQSVLDPACGSGTFLWSALRRYISAGREGGMAAERMLDWALNNIIGMDVHPVAVMLARATWLFAVRELLEETDWQQGTAVPVYLGDSLQLRTGYRQDQMFGDSAVIPIRAKNESQARELRFPVALVDQSDWFDDVMHSLAREIERGGDPEAWLDSEPELKDEPDLAHTARQLSELHDEGRNHIWAYYTRNLVRPIALSRRQVDVIVGNPPWINYNQTDGLIRDRMKELSRGYGIWSGGRYATHQDIAGLFFTRCAHLYLKDGGQMSFVLPHSALQTGQWSAWRSGDWADAASGRTIQMDMAWKRPWDLEGLEPNDFFPIASCVVFGMSGTRSRFANSAECWLGPAGGEMSRSECRRLFDTSGDLASPYGAKARQGATLVPRCLMFVELGQSHSKIRPAGTQVTIPRRGRYDKKPWKDLPLSKFHNMTVETEHVFDIYLGETLVPYATLEPLEAILPVSKNSLRISARDDSPGGVDPFSMGVRVRNRWRSMAELWDEHKKPSDGKSLIERIDYFGGLTAQFEWMRADNRQIRIAYTTSGRPTAAPLLNHQAVTDSRVYWIPCESDSESNYLMAVINSHSLYSAVSGFMSAGQFGPRDLHKHLWRLPIPRFNPTDQLHGEIAGAGARAAVGVEEILADLHGANKKVTVAIARREIRNWLTKSADGQIVESLIETLMESTADC